MALSSETYEAIFQDSLTPNVQSIKSAVLLNQDGSGKIETVFRNKGEFRELMNEILKSKIDEQKEAIVYGLSFKQPDSYQFSKSEGDNPGIGLMMEIEKVQDFIACSKYLLSPRLYKIWNRKLLNRVKGYSETTVQNFTLLRYLFVSEL